MDDMTPDDGHVELAYEALHERIAEALCEECREAPADAWVEPDGRALCIGCADTLYTGGGTLPEATPIHRKETDREVPVH